MHTYHKITERQKDTEIDENSRGNTVYMYREKSGTESVIVFQDRKWKE